MNTPRRPSLLAAAIAAALLGMACAQDEQPGARPQETAAAPGAAAPPPCEPQGSELGITALHYVEGQLPSFDKDCLAAPAGRSFTITLTNEDILEHNVSIYPEEGAAYSDALFHGELFRGPGESKTYEVPAIGEPGTYAFRCDEHLSTMTGTFVVA